ncbi:MAG: putative metalloprotease CJM1_0395 family protein, partial [Pseudomonadota bacterium]
YDYQKGPDGVNYAIGGSVPIDVATEDSPEATIAKMEIVIRAALAPAEPSAADRAIAAAANSKKAQAQADLAKQRAEE